MEIDTFVQAQYITIQYIPVALKTYIREHPSMLWRSNCVESDAWKQRYRADNDFRKCTRTTSLAYINSKQQPRILCLNFLILHEI